MEFIYRVKLNYDYFMFDDGEEALAFARTALEHQVEGRSADYDVKIDVIPIEHEPGETEDTEDDDER